MVETIPDVKSSAECHHPGGEAMIRNLLIAVIVSGVAFATGCHHKCHHKNSDCCPPAPIKSGPGGNPYLLPPANLPTTPTPPGGDPLIPSVGPMNPRNYTPNKPGPELILPDALPGTGSSRNSWLDGPPTRPKSKSDEPPVVPK